MDHAVWVPAFAGTTPVWCGGLRQDDSGDVVRV